MFTQGFKEGGDLSTTLEEIDGVVSVRAFHLLLQYLYTGRVNFCETTPEEGVTIAIEFARLADMCGVVGMESFAADHVKTMVLQYRKDPITSPIASHSRDQYSDNQNNNTESPTLDRLQPSKPPHFPTIAHIHAITCLPKGHRVRSMIARAIVERYFNSDLAELESEMAQLPGFAEDLLKAVSMVVSSIADEYASGQDWRISFIDPLSGERTTLKSFNREDADAW